MEKTANREMGITRTFKTSIKLMWEVWTNPEHIANWWGPKGFTNTIHQMDFQEGGEWKFTMHGPDGKNYPNRSIFKEIIPSRASKKISCEFILVFLLFLCVIKSLNSYGYSQILCLNKEQKN